MGKRINWKSDEIIKLLKDPSLKSIDLSKKLGISYWNLSRHRKKVTGKFHCSSGLGHALTNQERKARYNAKIKNNCWKPLYTINNNA